MSTASRKEREREARQELILDVAQGLLLERGYLGMNMDQIAQATEYSKGTIYQHFSCKEEVLGALAERMAAMRVAWFRRAATFRGLTRERMAAVGVSFELFRRLHPHHFVIEQIVTADSIRDKTSESRLASLQDKDAACMGIVTGVVRDAVAQGDLTLPDDTTPEDVVYGLWITTYGGMSMMVGKPDLAYMGIDDAAAALRRTQNAILDGYGWRPLYPEHDYDGAQQRALLEVFPDEARLAGLL